MNGSQGLHRRDFLVRAALAAGGVTALAGASRALSGGSGKGPCAKATASAVLCGPNEPGERMQVTGRVFAPDGATPAAGVTLYVYHTDARGHYNRLFNSAPRIRGWMRTGPDGAYSYRTIRPAAYPGGRTAAHVHTQIWGPRVPAQYGTDLLFEGDPLLTAEERRRSAEAGRFAFIRPVKRDGNGVWHAVHDIRLKSYGDRFEDNTMHGLSPCGVEP